MTGGPPATLGWPWVVLFCALLCVGGSLPGCTEVEPPPPSESARQRPDQEAWGWTTVVTKGGRRRAEVSAGHFQKSDRSRVAELDGGVTVTFFDASGDDSVSHLTARRAAIDEKAGELLVLGDVLLVARDSIRLTTDSLRWIRETETVVGGGQVTITRPDGAETGVGFEASSDLKRWSLKHVTTRLTSPAPDGSTPSGPDGR